MHFLDRTREINRLNAMMKKREGGLVVVYGRRRVGKTRLLLDWVRQNNGFYLVADTSASTVQRNFFSLELERLFKGFSAVAYPDWYSLFRRISSEAERISWKGPLVIDELPYLVQASPEITSVLQKWIDHDVKKTGMVVALAGSSQRMMQGLVLDHSDPLFGRAKEIISLQSIPAHFIMEAFKGITHKQAVEYYAVFGGIPFYWELASELDSDFESGIDYLALDPMGPLHREPERVLSENVPSALSLRPLLDTIGMGANRISEIAARLNMPATSLTIPLKRLVDMGFIRRDIPFGEPEKSSKRSLYRIDDPFFRFWFTLIAPNRAYLTSSKTEDRLRLWKKYKPFLCAQVWEDLCRNVVPALLRKRSSPDVEHAWIDAKRFWHGDGPEWDIVSRTVDNASVLLGETKWSDTPFGESELASVFKNLASKGVPRTMEGRKRTDYVICVPEYTVNGIGELPYILLSAKDIIEAYG